MSIYSTVSAHNKQAPHGEPIVPDIMLDDPMFKLSSLNEKATTLQQPVASEKDNLAEYYSDDEERENAIKEQKEKKQLNLIEKEK